MKRKKFLAIVLAFMMLFSLLVVPGFAVESLPTATDGVITLTEDVTLTSNVTFNEFVTINLNNKTLTATKLIFNGGAEIYGGTISFDSAYSADGFICADYKHYASSTVTIRNATVSAENSVYSTGVLYAENTDDAFILDNVQVNVSGGNTDPGSGVFYSPSSSARGKVVLKNNTSVTATKVNAVFFASDLNVDGAVIDCGEVYRPVFRQAAGTVNNTTVTIGSIETGKAIISDEGNAPCVLTFTESTITAPEGTAVVNFKSEGSKAEADDPSKLGDGSGITQIAPASGTVVKIGDATYSSLQMAMDAAQDGDIVTVLDDIELTEGVTIPAGKNVTLDLNGYTISQTKAQTGGYQMILNDGTLTIKDETGNGKISYTDSGNGGEYISDTIYNRGVLVIESGKIENLSSATVANNGYPHAVDTYSGIRDTAVTVNGGVIYCENYSAIRMFCVSETNKADLVINDGTIKGAVDMQNGSKDKACVGVLTVNGGTFEKNVSAKNVRIADWHYYGSTANISGIAINIKNGTFDSGIYNNLAPVTKFISGGTYGEDVSAYVADGFKLSAKADGTFTVGTLPNAEVSNMGAMTIGNYSVYGLLTGGGLTEGVEPKELQIAMEFLAKDSEAEAEANAFAEYTTDFFITIEGLATDSITGDGCYLAGNYGTFGWIVIPLDGFSIENGVTYPVITSVGFDFSYVDICTSVKDFKCGIYFTDEILAENTNMTVTLELGLSEDFYAARDDKEYITVDEYTYTAEELKNAVPTTIWSKATDAGCYMDGATKYGMMRFLFHADVNENRVKETGIKYVKASDIQDGVTGETAGIHDPVTGAANTNAFYGDVVRIPEGTEGDYYAVAYIKLEGMEEAIWSDFVKCTPNFSKFFTDYTGGAN